MSSVPNSVTNTATMFHMWCLNSVLANSAEYFSWFYCFNIGCTCLGSKNWFKKDETKRSHWQHQGFASWFYWQVSVWTSCLPWLLLLALQQNSMHHLFHFVPEHISWSDVSFHVSHQRNPCRLSDGSPVIFQT